MNNLPYKGYVKKGITQMRPYIPGENLLGVSVSEEDRPPKLGDMIARNVSNHKDRWLVSKEYFETHYEPSDAE